ncbi:charged multivesicular body protein 6 [Etheostoma cragini]|uniref:charged multivesicular body protein 6 n=1 Tax=Etheostoma cragini TaxID=417921 RepID=UPI00155EF14A|nr:charged multivesicular body protein 6 [Etheostoma cragini]
MSVEEVERIMDETQDAIEYQRQIDDMLAGSLSQEDEDAVLAELEAITQGDVELPEVPEDELPDVPEAGEEKPETERPRKQQQQQREMLAV